MSRGLPALKPKNVLRALGHAGFVVHHVTGSHCSEASRKEEFACNSTLEQYGPEVLHTWLDYRAGGMHS